MKKTTHVIQLVRELVPGNGVSNVCSELTLAFENRGISNEYITIKNFGIHNGSLLEKNRYKKRLKLIRDVIVFALFASYSAWRSKRKFEQSNPEFRCLVICHNDALYGDAYIAHGLHSRYTKENPKIILKNPFHLYMAIVDYLRYRVGLHNHYLFWNSRDASYCVNNNKLKKNSTTIPQGIPSPRKTSDNNNKLVARSIIIENSFCTHPNKEHVTWVFSFCGHEFGRKGLQIILDALSILNKEKIIACIAVAGDDSPENLQLPENVPIYFCGKIADAQKLFKETDALIMASAFETGPLVVLESLAVGTPVISTAVGFCQDIIKDKHNGYIVERTPSSIYEAIFEMIESGTLKSLMRENAKTSVSSFTWESVAAALSSGKH